MCKASQPRDRPDAGALHHEFQHTGGCINIHILRGIQQA